MSKKIAYLSLFLLMSLSNFAQPDMIEKVIAVVGSNIVTQSELEAQYLQLKNPDDKTSDKVNKCELLNQLLFQKMLLAQAVRDSVDIPDAQVEQELDRRMRYFIAQFGSEEKFAEFYNKSVEEFKNEMRDNIKELMLAQKIQAKITDGVTISPTEVKEYYNKIPKDSLPYISEEVEIGEIVKKPIVSQLAKIKAKGELQALYERIVKGGADFAALAVLNSEDPGSASRGGRYDSIRRGMFVPEFEAVMFKLKPNEISDVFESTFGYHIVQLIARRGEMVDIRHILITPKSTDEDAMRAKLLLDSIYNVIEHDSISFADAAAKYSDDEDSKGNSGLIANPQTGFTKFAKAELGTLDPALAFTIDKMKVGELTKPSITTSKDGRQVYRMLYLKSRTEPHVANLKDDYQKVQTGALKEKEQKIIDKWVKKKLPGIYVRIDDEYKDCKFSVNWITTNQ